MNREETLLDLIEKQTILISEIIAKISDLEYRLRQIEEGQGDEMSNM